MCVATTRKSGPEVGVSSAVSAEECVHKISVAILVMGLSYLCFTRASLAAMSYSKMVTSEVCQVPTQSP